jgi:hypothetical protein
MPPKISKKKYKVKGPSNNVATANATNDGSASAIVETTPPAPAVTMSTEDRAARGSSPAAAALALRFEVDYPPSHNIDDYEDKLPGKIRRQAQKAYSKCSSAYNRGIQLTSKASGEAGISCRWHAAQDAFLDAIDLAMSAPGSFLDTHGSDHRRLLCKAVLSVAMMKGRLLDGQGMLDWGRAAVAADPIYYNTHSQLSLGFYHCGRYEEALAEAQIALASEGAELEPYKIRMRVALLEKTVYGSKEEKRSAVLEVLTDKRGAAIRFWQEMGVTRPAKSCAMCFWGAENKCAKCRTVYYCQRICQVRLQMRGAANTLLSRLELLEAGTLVVCVHVYCVQVSFSHLGTLKSQFLRFVYSSILCSLSILQHCAIESPFS